MRPCQLVSVPNNPTLNRMLVALSPFSAPAQINVDLTAAARELIAAIQPDGAALDRLEAIADGE
jgi:hypothetical protein